MNAEVFLTLQEMKLRSCKKNLSKEIFYICVLLN